METVGQSDPECFLKCSAGIVCKLVEATYFTDNTPHIDEFQSMMTHFERLNSINDIKYQSFVMMGFNGGLQAETLYDKLIANKCDIVGINCVEPNVCTAVCRRTYVRSKLNLGDIVINHVFVMKPASGRRKEEYNKLVLSVLKAWMLTGTNCKINFSIGEAPTLTCEDLLNDWQDLNDKEVERKIIIAEEKIACKRPHTDRDSFIATMGRKILNFRRSSISTPSCVIYPDDHDILDLENFTDIANIMCKTVNPIDGNIINFPLPHWLEMQYFRVYTLVLHGNSSLGKTPLAMSMMRSVTESIFSHQSERPFFVKVETIDSLREAFTNNYLKEGVGIVFDDIEPSKRRGTRYGCTLEDMKALCDVTTCTNIHARYRDVSIPSDAPRVFTANAQEPCEWHCDLPSDVWSTSDAIRSNYSMHVKAVFKRTCFALVEHSLVPDAVRQTHDAKRRRVVCD